MQEEKEEHKEVHVPDSTEWVQLCDDKGKTYLLEHTHPHDEVEATSGHQGRLGRHEGYGRRAVPLAQGHPWPAGLLFLFCLLGEASRGEGLGIPSHLLGCHFWQSCSVSTCCLRRRVWDSSGSGYVSILCALLGSTADTVHVSVFGGFWLLFHTFPCDGGPRILRSILGLTHGFSTSPSHAAVTGSDFCRVRCTGYSGFTGR